MAPESALKILFIARNYPPVIGGMEKNAESFYLNVKKLAQVDLQANPLGKKNLIPFSLQTLLYLVRNVKKYDVVHFSDAVLSPMLPLIRLFSNAKITFTVHGLDVVYSNPLYSFTVRHFLSRADRIFPVSKYTYEQCVARGIKPEKLLVIPNGITPENIPLHDKVEIKGFLDKHAIEKKNQKILFSIGRLVERKGHAWFIQNVFPRLPDDTLYFIGGEGPDFPKVLRLIEEGGYSGRIIAPGRVSEDEKQMLYQIADLFIMPNITVKNDPEGFGIVLLEAGTYNVPVIATNIEGISSAVIDGVTGRLITEGDVQGFVDAITNCEIDRAAIRTVIEENFTWTNIARMYLDEFQKLVGR